MANPTPPPLSSAQASLMGKRRHRSSASAAIRQALAMQDKLQARVLDDGVSPREQASCACAWERLEERLRILRGKPLPGQYRPEVKAKPKALPLWSGPTEA